MSHTVATPIYVQPPVIPTGGGRSLSATYENARTTTDNKKLFSQVDYFSGRSANHLLARRTLRTRSRYEVANNPYLFGIVHGYVNDVVGRFGAKLQALTDDDKFNTVLEARFEEWCQAVDLVEKIRTFVTAQVVDGEAFNILKTAPGLDTAVQLYPLDIESDQVSGPFTSLKDVWLDGVILDEVTQKPSSYTVMKNHPGDLGLAGYSMLEYVKVPARLVAHYFLKSRPGQVRGVPIFAPSLELFAELRSFRKAVLRSAEIAADISVLLESAIQVPMQNRATDSDTWTTYNIERGQMMILPPGMKPASLMNEQPATSYEMFQEKCIGEACRPLQYPLNLALGTSQKFNFSSAKLDHINYRTGTDAVRSALERAFYRTMLREWYEEAVNIEGYLPRYIPLHELRHSWHWEGYPVLDPLAETEADIQRLKAGLMTLSQYWARSPYSSGQDWRVMLEELAKEIDFCNAKNIPHPLILDKLSDLKGPKVQNETQVA